MEKHPNFIEMFERMMSRLEGQNITDPLVKMMGDEIVSIYSTCGLPGNFEVDYLWEPMGHKYGVHFSESAFYENFAAMAAQICQRLEVDDFREKFLKQLTEKKIRYELSPPEITFLMFPDIRESDLPYEYGIQIATLPYNDPEIEKIEGKLGAEFKADFMAPYEWGDPDLFVALSRKIRREFEERKWNEQLLTCGPPMFKRILDQTFSDLFYRWTALNEFLLGANYEQFSVKLFHQ